MASCGKKKGTQYASEMKSNSPTYNNSRQKKVEAVWLSGQGTELVIWWSCVQAVHPATHWDLFWFVLSSTP